jgi:NodT family efflux transporter outer membrane factor (OMF) lipoprotein
MNKMNTSPTFNFLLYVSAALSLSACAVGPDFVEPNIKLPASLTRSSDQSNFNNLTKTTTPIESKWWLVYRSNKINELVDLSISHNPNLESGLANLKQAQEYVKAQRGLYFPQIGGNLSSNKQNSGSVIASPLASGNSLFTLQTGQLNVGFVPDIFGANQRQIESLEALAENQALQLQALKTTIASNVVMAVIQDEYLAQEIELTKKTINTSQKILNHSKFLLKNGYASAIDLAQQETLFQQYSALLPPLQKQFDLNRDLLATLCGQYSSEELNALNVSSLQQAIVIPNSLPSALPSDLVNQRPDVQAAQSLLHAAHAQIGIAVANMLPQLSISANVNYAGNSFSGLFGPSNQAWSLLGNVTQPLFSAGSLSAKRRAAEEGAQAARAQYQSVVLAAFQNVADTLYTLSADDHFMEISLNSEASNQTLYELSSKQFKAGYISEPILLGVEQNYLQSKINTLMAKSNYLSDTVALFQALGGGWRSNK